MHTSLSLKRIRQTLSVTNPREARTSEVLIGHIVKRSQCCAASAKAKVPWFPLPLQQLCGGRKGANDVPGSPQSRGEFLRGPRGGLPHREQALRERVCRSACG